ncbi:MAG: exodeoxyribonuclease III [Alphaproteobacteria bacterium]
MKKPKSLNILTWNVNSIRVRIEQLEQVCSVLNPDVVCLQETKVKNYAFPYDKCKNMGFKHIAARGNSGYNGVAILSKYPFNEIQKVDFCGKDDSRHIAVQINDIIIHNFYVPAGGYEPNIETNDKFLHKLMFIEEMASFFLRKNQKQNLEKTIILGDLNVAPLEYDVWNHEKMLQTVSHTPDEVSRFNTFLESGDFIDAIRHFIPETERVYTWWSYRSPKWSEVDKGRRLDHIIATPDMKPNLTNLKIFKDTRDFERPSDHVPVMLNIAL